MDDNELLMSGFTKQKVFFNGGSLSLIFINPKKIRMLIIIIIIIIIIITVAIIIIRIIIMMMMMMMMISLYSWDKKTFQMFHGNLK